MFAYTANPAAVATETKINVENLDVYYGAFHAIKDASLKVPANRVTALIGPSGCGKSTFIRALNRMHDLTPGARVEGRVLLDGQRHLRPGDRPGYDPAPHRHGLSAAQPVSEIDLRQRRLRAAHSRRTATRGVLMDICERSLRHAALWDEVKDRLDRSALELSGGQQQRLCIARCLAVDPEVILMDEPASALDPIATSKIEDLIEGLKRDFTVVIVTHSMQQAARVSDYTAFFLLGDWSRPTPPHRSSPNREIKRTEDYITGRFG